MKHLLFIGYGIFLLCFVGFSYLFIDPGLLYLHPLFTNFFQLHRPATTVSFVICILLFFGFYASFLYLLHNNKVTKKEIFFLIGLSGAFLLFAYPAMLSFDIFNYIATARVTFFYHENPYLIMPTAFTNDPLLLFMHAANKTALYAPIWIFLTGIPYVLGFGNFLVILLNFKVFVALFYIATVLLIWKMTKDIFKTTLFALNPLVLIEVFVSAHNDIVMMFLLLLSIDFLFQKRKGEALFFLLLSIGIKYITVVLTPLYIYSHVKEISKEKFFFLATICMYALFFLSSLREEIYPWYSLWFLLPVIFLSKNKFLPFISLVFSFSMLLRYIPFMLLGTYFGPTPFLKIALMLIPPVIATVMFLFHKKRFL